MEQPGSGDTERDEVRDRVTVRRGLIAGAVVWVLAAASVGGWQLWLGAGSRGFMGGVLVGLVLGSLATAAWLALAAALDLVFDHRPDRRRLAWTIGALAFALISPLLVLAAPA